ncbi:MAG: hypothetical protein K0S07_1101 [Chlamydiales bacterium]|jgi:hypothetical protein|nr:hypothetical protein [Chlamydiales bacterium]
MTFELYIGFALDGKLRILLDQANSQRRQFFIGKEDYLVEYECEGVAMIGKNKGPCLVLSELPVIESHIKSLLLRLVPEEALHGLELVVSALPKGAGLLS